MQVWGVASKDDEWTLRSFKEQMGLSFPILLDSSGNVNDLYDQTQAFPSAAYPQDWIIGSDGLIVYQNNGFEVDAMRTVLDAELD